MRAAALALALAGCYTPHPQDGSWLCDENDGWLCPDGLTCDRGRGLCVKQIVASDAGLDLALPDLSSGFGLPSCDDRVTAGKFYSLTNLGPLNSSGDEHALAITSDGKRLYFLAGNALQTATAFGPGVGGLAPVTVMGGPATLNGGSFTSDGTYWFSGTTTGTTQLWSATGAHSTPTMLTAGTPLRPTATDCAFTDPVFSAGDAMNELFIGYPLAGCALGGMIAIGAKDKDKGTFYGATPMRGVRSPSLLPAPDAFARTLLMSTSGPGARLYYASRSIVTAMGGAPMPGAFSTPHPLPMGALGDPTGPQGDVEALVSPDCTTIYLVSDRAGTKGGLDLWAATIALQ